MRHRYSGSRITSIVHELVQLRLAKNERLRWSIQKPDNRKKDVKLRSGKKALTLCRSSMYQIVNLITGECGAR